MLNDPNNSPLLRTIYNPIDGEDVEPGPDSTVFIAVNDQPAQGNNAFNHGVSNNGHVKFMTSSQAIYQREPGNFKVSTYLIQHSLPRFPNILKEDMTTGPIKATKLPKDRAKIFDSNATENAQHFLCMSFEDTVAAQNIRDVSNVRKTILRKALAYNPASMPEILRDSTNHFAAILHYLKVVNAAVVATNYNPFEERFIPYHRYLNVYTNWSKIAQQNDANSNLVPSRYNLDRNIDSLHLCPIWPVPYRGVYEANGSVSKRTKGSAEITYSLRSSGSGPCRFWNLGQEDILCLASANLKTTSLQSQLTGILMMKAEAVSLSPFDDLVSPLTVPLTDYEVAKDLSLPEQKMSMGLIVQSWSDTRTFAEDQKQLLPPTSPLQVDLTITNSRATFFPVEGKDEDLRVPNGSDHSKWTVAFPKAQVGSYAELFCISDLNRTGYHIKRGGANTCFSEGPLAQLMLSLKPELRKASGSFEELMGLYTGFKQSIATAVAFDEKNTKVYVASQMEGIKVSFHRLPNPFASNFPTEKVAIPRLLAHPDCDWSSSIEIVGDARLKEQDDIELSNQTLLQDEIGPFMAGAATEVTDIKLESGEELTLSIPLIFWARIQQVYQHAFGKSKDLTMNWLSTVPLFQSKKQEVTDDETSVTVLTEGAADDTRNEDRTEEPAVESVQKIGIVQKVFDEKAEIVNVEPSEELVQLDNDLTDDFFAEFLKTFAESLPEAANEAEKDVGELTKAPAKDKQAKLAEKTTN